MEPPNNDTLGTSHFFIYRALRRLKENGTFGTLKCVLYREVFSFVCFIWSVLVGGSTDIPTSNESGMLIKSLMH